MDPNLLESMFTAARVRASQLRARLSMAECHFEDVEQELLLDLLERAHRFDPAIASANTFTGLVTQHRATELLDRTIKQLTRFVPFSDVSWPAAANDDEYDGIPDNLSEHAASLWAQDADLFADSMALRDLQAATAFMTKDQASLLHLLIETPDLPAAQKMSCLSHATFYRRVEDLRMHLRMFGLREAA